LLITEIRFIDVGLLEVGKDLMEVEIFEFIEEEVKAVLMPLRIHPFYLM